MKLHIYFPVLVFLGFFVNACKVEPQSIVYGSDGCHFCSMTIVDQQHAAQIVTKKGKAFKFDASECMMNHLKEIDEAEIELFLVNDYSTPSELIDATQATYIISKGISSPMGAFLTAFSDEAAADYVQKENGGELFTWSELQEKFK